MEAGRSGLPQGQPLANCLFSEAELNFRVPPINIQQAHVEELDRHPVSPNRGRMRGGANLASRIAHALVSLQVADDRDLNQWVRQNPGQAAPEELFDRRWRMFSDAFARMFPSKRLASIQEIGSSGSYTVIFEEYGRRISLDDLSSGEKQIVFRGAFLLRKLTN